MIALRPSASKFWTQCPAYPRLVAALPAGFETENDPAREGTCAAWVAEQMIDGIPVKAGDTHANGWVVDDEMIRLMQRYVTILRSLHPDGMVACEFHVRLNPYIAGTSDAWVAVWTDAGLHLYVIDLKYGYGIVEPYRNTQLSIYAGAVLRMLQQQGQIVTGVTLMIHQPRAAHPAGPTRRWDMTIAELEQWVAWIESRGEMCQGQDPVAVAGEHCADCPAASTCHAVGKTLYQAHGTMLASQQRHMTREELATELTFLDGIEKMLKARRNMVEAEASAHIEAGRAVPGWSLEPGKGHRKWKYDPALIEALTGVSTVSDKPITPAELVRRGADEGLVDTLTETPRTKPSLVRITSDMIARKFT